ncbi:MAG: hypothetical protein VX878_01640, partial [Pseudomonadota bacterium]|nr:hypothetical protein [Pseudomonadota bacterium]
AAPVDRSTWTANGNGSWNLAGDNNSVKQTLNNSPTVFINQKDSQGLALSGTIKVETTSDDDFIGFVLGYNNGDLTNGSADYLLIDWKQGNQSFYAAPDLPDFRFRVSPASSATTPVRGATMPPTT